MNQVTWSRRLSLDDDSLQILSIGDQVHINDQRFLIAKTQQDNVEKSNPWYYLTHSMFLIAGLGAADHQCEEL